PFTREKKMLNPYLFYNDNCEAAFKFYAKALGGKIEMMLRADEGPPEMKPGPGREKLIMHARMSIDGQVLMASDSPPEHSQATGFCGVVDGQGSGGGRAQVQGAGRGRQRQHAVWQNIFLEGIRHVHRSVRYPVDGERAARGNVDFLRKPSLRSRLLRFAEFRAVVPSCRSDKARPAHGRAT